MVQTGGDDGAGDGSVYVGLIFQLLLVFGSGFKSQISPYSNESGLWSWFPAGG